MPSPIRPNRPNPNRPLEKPITIKKDEEIAAKAKAEAAAKAHSAPVEGKGKKPMGEPAPDPEKATRKKKEKTMRDAGAARFEKDVEYKMAEARKKAQQAGAGTSGIPVEKKPSHLSTAPNSILGRSNSNLRSDSSSSFGSAYSAGSLPSTAPDSPLPKDISRSSSGLSNMIEVPIMGAGADWPAKRPGQMNFDQTMHFTPAHSEPNSPHGSESSSSGPSLSRSTSEASGISLNPQNLLNFKDEMTSAGKWKGGDSSSMPNAPGSSRHTRSASEASKFSLNSEDVRDFQGWLESEKKIPGYWKTRTTEIVDNGPLGDEKIHVGRDKAGLKPAKKPEPFTRGGVPKAGTGSSENTSKKEPTHEQTLSRTSSVEEQAASRTPSMEAALNGPLPETNWDFTKTPPEKKPALTTGQKIGLGVLAAGTAAAVILPAVLGSKDDSSNGDGSVQT